MVDKEKTTQEIVSLKEKFPENLISLGYRGSHAHGLYVPNDDPNSVDDVDIMGVWIGPVRRYVGLGMSNKSETKELWVNQYDCVFYEVRKMVGMLLNFNPNVISYLFNNEENFIFNNEFQVFVDNKEWFLSKRAYKAFLGYASGQMHKMDSHGGNQGYMGEKRRKLVEKFGYDCKNAAHLIRLLKMGIEIVRDQRVIVKRINDREVLSEIKLGLWKKEAVVNYANYLFKIAHEAFETTRLPDEPQTEKIESELIGIIKNYIGD